MRTRDQTRTAEIQVGPDYRGEVRFSRPMNRIGSHPSSEVRLPEEYSPPHLATIEVRDGIVWLHNRSGRVVLVDADEVADEGSRVWSTGETARLTPHVTLRLGDGRMPRPIAGPRPLASPVRSTDEPMPVAGKSPSSRNPNMASYALTGLILLALAGLILGNAGSGEAGSTGQLAGLVGAARGDEEDPIAGDPFKIGICQQIQAGRAAELRDDAGRARRLYRNARDVLLACRRLDGHFPDPWLEDAFAFVRDRLRN